MVSVLRQSRIQMAVNKRTVSGFTYFLYMLFVVSFFLHLASRIPGVSAFRPDFLLALLIMVMLFVQQSIVKDRLNNVCNKYLIVLLAYIILSLPFVEWPGSILKFNLQQYIEAIVFFYFTLLIVDTDKRLKTFISVFIVCQLFRVFEPLYLNITEGYWGSSTYLGPDLGAELRLAGAPHDVVNPNGLAFVIATLFPFLHYLWGNSKWLLRICYVAAIPPLLYALVLTASRSGFIAFAVVVCTIFIQSKHKLILALVTVCVAIFAWGSMSDFHRDRYLSITGDESAVNYSTFKGRIDGVFEDFELGFRKPIFGHGIKSSKEAHANFLGNTQISHNLYAETFIELGIIGFIIFMLFIKSIYSVISNNYKKINNKTIAVNMPGFDHNYYNNLVMATSVCFWMYIIFSLAQYGLSEYHWYLLGGLVCVINYVISQKITEMQGNK